MYLRWCALILLVFTTVTAQAAAVHPSILMEGLHAKVPVRLQSLYITGNIAGSMAETTVRMVFFNPNSRALEGHLQFPLLAGQRVTAFALDINGAMRPAVPVESVKEPQIVDAIERRKVNVGIQEQTPGHNFKLRVYPIPAMGTRTIELKYSETMTRERKSWWYRLPLAYGERLRNFDLTLSIHGSSDVPRISGELGALHFGRDVRGYVVHVTKNKFAPSGVLSIEIPTAQHTLTYLHEHDGDTYFVTEIPLAAAKEGAQVSILNADGATAILIDAADAQQGLLRVVGKLRASNATLTLTIIEPGKSEEMTTAISANDPRHPMAATLWARYQLHALESDEDANRAAIRGLGEQFAIATRETSLIVLGRLKDYVRYAITPPAKYLAAYEK